MTPKEKAEELFNKYATYAVMWTGGIKVEKQNCKQCALIAVDEILNQDKGAFDLGEIHYHFEYWQEVKNEIEKA